MNDVILSYMFRIFWALFLGFGLVFSFKNSWKAEHGQKNFLSSAKNDTVIFLDPLIFPLCIPIYMGVCVLLSGWENSQQFLFSLLTDLFSFITLYFSLLLLLLPFLRKHYTARTCATFWLIPVFLFYQPNVVYSSFTLPTKAVFYVPSFGAGLLFLIWLAGFVIIFFLQILSHLRFSKMMRRHSQPVEDPVLLEMWKHCKRDLNIGDLTRPLMLRYSPLIRTPLTIGMYRTNWVTYLPKRSFSPEEAELIFSHELHHIQRHDTHTKFFLGFCTALGWPHPLVWLAVKKAKEDLELSCDEIVLKSADRETRKKYAELLLTSAGDSRGYTTCLSASAKTLRYRLNATITQKQRRLGLGLLLLSMILSCFSIGNFALTTERESIVNLAEINNLSIREAGFLPEGTQDDGQYIPLSDTSALSQYLNSLEIERFLTLYNEDPHLKGPCISGVFETTDQSFFLTGSCLTVYDVVDHELTKEQYHVCTPIDWEYVQSLQA